MTPWMCWRSWFQLSSTWPPQPRVHPLSSSMGQFCATEEEKQVEPFPGRPSGIVDPTQLILRETAWG